MPLSVTKRSGAKLLYGYQSWRRRSFLLLCLFLVIFMMKRIEFSVYHIWGYFISWLYCMDIYLARCSYRRMSKTSWNSGYMPSFNYNSIWLISMWHSCDKRCIYYWFHVVLASYSQLKLKAKQTINAGILRIVQNTGINKCSETWGIWTLDPTLKRRMLYRLS